MIPGYERTDDSQNPDLALTGLLAEYTNTNDSSSEIIYFSNNGTATAHSDGRMYSYEKYQIIRASLPTRLKTKLCQSQK